MKILGIIPARFASTRLPGKLLKEVQGKSIIQMVYEQCLKAKSLTDVVVAADSDLIVDHISEIGGRAVKTSEKHPSGTDRCAEALEMCGGSVGYDFVINIQGDEPLMDPENIDRLASSFRINTEISSAYIKIDNLDALLDPNKVKVVIDDKNRALYFSRAPIPHFRGEDINSWTEKGEYYKHLGLYGFRSDVLLELVNLPLGRLEQIEKLEQLRWLASGFTINMVEVFSDGIGIDTEEDLIKLRQFLRKE